MPFEPRLVPTSVPKSPEGVVLVLHGGASRAGNPMVSPTQLSVVRMIPIAHAIARASRRRLAVYRLLNSTRGWDTRHTPVQDAHWALDELAVRFGPLPSGLVGHSLGGRAAILAGGHDAVRSVVALNPWVYPTDGRAGLPGRSVLVVHGDGDRIADPRRSAAVAHDLRRAGEAGYVTVAGGKHAMLRRSGVFTDLASDFTRSVLLGTAPSRTIGDALAGRDSVTV
jgi:alpha-beta hydrolase superfamily lysophospholipase